MRIGKNGKPVGTNNSYNKPEYKEKLVLKKLGKLNPNYKHGKSYYYKYYQPLAKTLIQCCFMCGSTKKLIVHHIDYNYKNNSLNNLSIVCRGCHNKIHKTKLNYVNKFKNKNTKKYKADPRLVSMVYPGGG